MVEVITTLRIEEVLAAASNIFKVPFTAGRSKSLSLSFGVMVKGLAAIHFSYGQHGCFASNVNIHDVLPWITALASTKMLLNAPAAEKFSTIANSRLFWSGYLDRTLSSFSCDRTVPLTRKPRQSNWSRIWAKKLCISLPIYLPLVGKTISSLVSKLTSKKSGYTSDLKHRHQPKTRDCGSPWAYTKITLLGSTIVWPIARYCDGIWKFFERAWKRWWQSGISPSL